MLRWIPGTPLRRRSNRRFAKTGSYVARALFRSTGGVAMTLYVWSPSAPRLGFAAEQHARAVMVASNETSRRLVELEYTEDGVIVGAHMKHVSLAGLANSELERIEAASQALRRERMDKARAKGKIGVNERCPCGSGKKFERCHGRAALSARILRGPASRSPATQSSLPFFLRRSFAASPTVTDS